MKSLFTTLLLIITGYQGMAQYMQTLYQLDPHANVVGYNLNPAYISDAKVTVGLLLGNFSAQGRIGMSANEMFSLDEQNNTLTLKPEKFLENAPDTYYNRIFTNYNLLFVGVSNKKSYFTFAIDARAFTEQEVSNGLLSLAVNGNGFSEEDLANGLSSKSFTSALSTATTAFGQAALGYSKNIDDRLTIGGRAKFLWGIGHASSNEVSLTIQNDLTSNSTTLTTEGGNFQTAGVVDFMDPDGNKVPTFTGNYGMAIDLGATYRLTEKVTLSASLLDLGGIKWTKNGRQLSLKGGSYAFDGIDVEPLINLTGKHDHASINLNEDVLRELEETLQIDTLSNQNFHTALPAQWFLGGSYQLAERHRVGGTWMNSVYKGRWLSGFSAFYNIYVGAGLSALVNWTGVNGTYANVGAGLRLNMGAVQWHISSDNLLAAFKLENARNFSLATGINFQFGRKDMKVKNW
ncbi:DUF5723 family protein [Persicobacter diffluens]|uniref:DUF5723 domain-containing protein n=1 Tax=Persicobacter diffluens TaxID=981 RepID=A0AAN4W319_9BACT|nr:hypothetical protein PEDI_42750 [Persicobacter diffluens]